MEGFINLFVSDNTEGNKPHYKLLFKIDGVDHEAALWPAKNGKKGFVGKYKPKSPKPSPVKQEAINDQTIPF